MRRCIALLLLLSLVFVLSACIYEQRIPTDGIWYCEELQAQFTVDYGDGFLPEDYVFVPDEFENYVIVDGDRIASSWGNDRGSMKVDISCQEPDHPVFRLGQIIYLLEFVSLSDTEYVLKDDAGTLYTFVRIGDTPIHD